MNKAYKVIWNASLGAWVAVSELAKSSKKSKSVKIASLLILPIGFLGLNSQTLASTANLSGNCTTGATNEIIYKKKSPGTIGQATDGSGTYSTVIGCSASGGGNLAVTSIGGRSSVTGDAGTALGWDASAAKWGVSIGVESRATGQGSVALGVGSTANAADSIAIGRDAVSGSQNSVALGHGSITAVQNGSSFLTNINASTVNGTVSVGTSSQTRRIQNVADGSADQDAVTVAQLKVLDTKNTTLANNFSTALGGGATYDKETGAWTGPTYNITDPTTGATTPVTNVGDAVDGLNAAVNSPITFKDADGGTSSNKLGSEFTIVGDDNITTTVTDGKAAIALNKDLKGLTSVETTDGTNTTTLAATGTTSTDGTNTTVYGANGLNINNGAIKLDSAGLNAGGVIISKDGINANNKVISNIGNALDEKDATNLGQVENLIADATGSITSKGFALKAQDGKTVNKKLGEAIEIEGDENISTSVKNDKIALSLTKDLKVDSISAGGSILNASGLVVGNTSVTSGGVFIAGGPSISSSGINAGNKTISNVAAGVNINDAINKGQFDEAVNSIKENIGGLTDSAVQYDKNADGSVNKDSISLGGTDGTLITNVANGKVESGSKDAINGGQLADIRDDLQGQITDNTNSINNIKNEINNGSLGLVQQTDPKGDITVAKNTGGNKVNITGTDGDRVLTGVANGSVSKGSTDAINGDQLNTNYENMASSLGGGAKLENGAWTGPNYTVGHGDSSKTVDNVGDAVTALNNADQALDSKINNLGTRLEDTFRSTNDRVNRLEKDTKAAVAASIAIASLPQPFEKGTSMLSAGTGVWEGQVGVSIGASGITEDKKVFQTPVNYVWKFASTTDSQGNWGGGASVGVQWK